MISDLNSYVISSGTEKQLAQSRRIAVIDIIIRDQRNSRRMLVVGVRVNAVEHDAINAVLTGNLRRAE